MIVLEARNVNSALAAALQSLLKTHTLEETRNGPVMAFPTPVTTVYERPTERVLINHSRRANPFFHLLESLWMLAGQNDVKFPATLVKNMENFSDNGINFWGAYGWRWRSFFGWDQLEGVIKELSTNPNSRRAVVGMWNPGSPYSPTIADLNVAATGGKDVPCNTAIYFDCRGGVLNMTVTNRSNDVIWGAYGANAVHMSILQEYVALSLGVPMGRYYQVSNNLHVYLNTFPVDRLNEILSDALNPYASGDIQSTPLWGGYETKEHFDQDLWRMFKAFDEEGMRGVADETYLTDFFNGTVTPMVRTWMARANKSEALNLSATIESSDWAMAARFWLSSSVVSA